MKIRLSIKKGIIFLAITAVLISSVTGCIEKKGSQAQNSPNAGNGSKPIEIQIPSEGKGSGTIANNNSPKANVAPKTQDADLTQKLGQEKEILGGQIYVQDDMIIAAMNIKAGVTQADAEALANRYMEELKKKYSGKAINIQAVQSKKNIVNLTYQP